MISGGAAVRSIAWLCKTGRSEMATTIWKEPLPRTGTNIVTMPWPFRILSVQVQNGARHLWAEVEDGNPVMVTRSIEVYGTGWEIPSHPEPKRFIGTVQNGPFVWHVFERGDGSTKG